MGTLEELYSRAGARLATLGAELAGEASAGLRLRDDAVVAVLGDVWRPRDAERAERRVETLMRRRAPRPSVEHDPAATLIVTGRR